MNRNDDKLLKFREEVRQAVNRNSLENLTDDSDFSLAEYLVGCLCEYAALCERRKKCYDPGSRDRKKMIPDLNFKLGPGDNSISIGNHDIPSRNLCGNCNFYDLSIKSCRKGVPILVEGISGWPNVNRHDWCGEWKKRVEYPALFVSHPVE